MNRSILTSLCAFLILGHTYFFAQTTFVTDNFEGTFTWNTVSNSGPNNWIQGNCTNNGGSSALYITSGGSTNDCTPSGITHYGYANTASGSETAIVYREVNASCFTAITVLGDIQIEGESGIDYLELVISTDNGLTWSSASSQLVANATYSPFSQLLPGSFDNTIFWIGFRFNYNDSNIGNKAPAIDNFRIQGTSSDIVSPTITCPSPSAVYSDQYCEFPLLDYGTLATVNDACGIVSTIQTPAIGTTVNANTLITLQAIDPSGNSTNCSFTLTVIDTITPKVTCIPLDSVYATAACNAAVPNLIPTVSVIEFCTPANSLIFNQTPAAGTIISATQNVFVTVTDLSGNVGGCFTHMLLFDTISPQITCPANQTVSTNNGCTYDIGTFTTQATVTDNCSTTFLLNQSPAIGNSLPVGPHSITIQAIDQQGNAQVCQFTLTVQDLTLPVVNCPTGITAPVNNQCLAMVGNLVPLVSATDNCTASNLLVFAQNKPANLLFSDTITVLMTAVDLNGNIGSCSILVTAIDTLAPVVTCLNDTILAISGTCSMTVPNLAGTHSAVENCAPSNLLLVSQNPIAGTVITNPVGIVISYTDTAGNIGTCITQAIPIESINPTITCPPAQSINNGVSCFGLITDLTALATVTDNCTGYSLTQIPAVGTNLVSGTHIVTITATDLAGNSASCTTSFTIIETSTPSITCPGNMSVCNPLVNYTNPIGTDNCFFKITQTDLSGVSSGSIFPIGTTTQTYQIEDSSGNTSSCSFTVQVLPYPDTAFIPNSLIYLCDTYTTSIQAQAIQSGTGSWNVLTGTGTLTNPNALQTTIQNLSAGSNTVEWVVTSPTCGTRRDTVQIIVNMPPSQAALQDSMYACATTNYIIQGNNPAIGQGTWSSNAGITFNNIHAPVSTILSIPNGYHTIYWTINTSGCQSTVDSAIIYAPIRAEVLTHDTTLCLTQLPFNIQGIQAGLDQATYWIEIGGSGTLTSKYTANTSLTAAAPGELILLYKLHHDFCGATQDTLHIILNACDDASFNIPTVFTPNHDGSNDQFIIPNLYETYPDCEVTIINRWGAKVFQSTGYSEPWDGTYKGDDLPLGTYFYEIVSPNNDFKPFKGSISIIR
ncbi:HYR domain-containing protein [Fluviicola taffensis]|uniref:Hyalin n=1 Tax=Fluviicola taffensis (strain DSM 16823 / NCIMB 13979 / RW262) TaxID=755732 RepID=F2IKB8_FLUTR|nr:HYR domain-containing protein [Fluviicola taffensis]AEA44021.1 Hyalin [Fluviicola taffensis DSM 16823]